MTAAVTAVATGVGAAVGISIIKALRQAALPVRVVGVDAEPLSSGLFMADSASRAPWCLQDPDGYFEALVALCRREGAQVLFSGWEGELPLLCERKAEFEERTGTLLPFAPAAVRTALDKWATVLALQQAGVGAPDSALPGEAASMAALRQRHGFPYVIKPRRGWGGQKLFVVQTEEELAFFSRYVPDPVLQERLDGPDREYTVGVFMQENGRPGGVLPLRRTLVGGFSYRMHSDANAEAAAAAVRACVALGVVGPANVQLRLTGAGARVFEVNPRCSTSTCVRAWFGLNEPERTIRRFVLGEELEPVVPEQGWCLRHLEERYLSEAEAARVVSAP
jgi:carbamoyl-phosphate synthase large subunit